ncbi:DnaT-like ssDNA-binding domain-containing protein [Cobetia amphilecti]|uniref:DnaT-like ssDNA-binding domain-containing protein n=1 Tax=Cobetia amphilecti TaxID=1055104 RepID=A0ABT6UTW1_9GAMM|nr:DnaT-like ssDNA-binding domain-containing protein [Cobetia amphilecti]MDI5886149.1 DnaT-like ssDNA-binding domain-containing protein [Cobetia amphilecti]
MSLHAMSWAREVMPEMPESIKAGPRLLLLLMADYANEQGVCWPSVRRLADEMACSMRTVQRAIEALVEQGVMTVVARKTPAGRQTSNFYRLAMGNDQQQPQAADEPSPEELEALMAGSDEEEVPAEPATAPAQAEHPIFANAAQQADNGQPQATAGARQVPMTLDWQPDATHWQTETMRRGDPSLTWDQGELADFTAHFADQPGRRHSHHAWCAKFAGWVSENRKREAARQARMSQNANTSSNNTARNAGGTHGSRRSTGPIRNSKLSAAEGRALIERRRREQAEGQPPSGDVIDGEWL